MDPGLVRVWTGGDSASEIRMFDSESVQTTVDRLLGDVLDDENNAILHLGADGVALATRWRGGPWSIALYGKRTWGGDFGAGAVIKASW